MRKTSLLLAALALSACTSITAPSHIAPPEKPSRNFTITAGRDGGLICVDTETGQEVPMENCI